jgi:hypothetical protein
VSFATEPEVRRRASAELRADTAKPDRPSARSDSDLVVVLNAPRRRVSLEAIVVAALTLFGFRMGAGPLHDNSMFTHLRTGVDMVRNGAIPRTDPYSFSAHRAPWVVQSWLAEWTYGLLEHVGGLRLVVLEQGVLTALLALLVARLARTGSPWRTATAALIALGAGAALWSERPLLFGLVCFALVATIVERRRSVWLLVPVAWVWVNTHGSFVFGALWLGAVAVGETLDVVIAERRLAVDRVLLARFRALGVFCLGLLLGAVNPLGPKLLLFPLAVGDKAEVFKRIVEWRSPNFQSTEGAVTLVCVCIAAAVLFRTRPGWRDILPVLGFVALGLFAVRNLPVAAVVLAAPLGRALTSRRDGSSRSGVHPLFAGALLALAAVFVVSAYQQTPVGDKAYPIAAVDHLQETGVLPGGHRVVTQDFVGNYLELRYGTRTQVFIDDRSDMYPVAVSNDYFSLLDGRPDAFGVLDHYRADAVLWKDDKPLVGQLRLSSQWREDFHRDGWVVFVRR